MKKLINGVEVEMTEVEIEALEAQRAVFVEPVTPQSVSSRQFKLQLLAAGLLDAVDAWVVQQPREIRIAYEYSGTFVRGSPMMAEGFAAMGFSQDQVDEFFAAAATL